MKTSDEAFNQFITKLESYLELSTTFKMELRNVAHLVYYKKGTKIQYFEQIPDQLWFLIAGFAKETTKREASLLEWVTWFWQKNDFLFTDPGLFSISAADSQIELVMDSDLIHICYSDCIKLRETFPVEASKLIKLIRGKAAKNRKRHHILISSKTLHDRSEEIKKDFPGLTKVAKRKDIMEFLGSTDDSFRNL